MKKSKITTILIVIITIILAGVAIFTATRLYNLRDQAVAPTAPTSRPAAQVSTSCEVLTFTITTPTGSGTSSPTPTSTSSSSPTPTETSTSTSQDSTATPTTTTTPELPDAGTSWPTVLGGGLGILVIFGALLLAL